jgi:hypothetical protein
MPTGVFAASPIVISCIAGMGSQQADKVATGDMNTVIASAIDNTNLDRPAITVQILLSAQDLYSD